MKLKPCRGIPCLLGGVVILGMIGLQIITRYFPDLDFFQRLEWITYDWRMRQINTGSTSLATNLGFVYVSDETIAMFSEGKLGTNYQFGLYWPRHIYGQVVRELSQQGARQIGLDVLFGERRRDYDQRLIPTPERPLPSDYYFRHALEQAGNVVLGATPEVPPHRLFRAGAAALGDISMDREADGVLRRIQTFRDYRIWHEDIRLEAALNNWDLSQALISSNRIRFPKPNGRYDTLPLSDGMFDAKDLSRAYSRTGIIRLQLPFEDVRVWHMGIVLAARALGLNLDRAEVDLPGGRITLRGADGLKRVLPVDAKGRLLVNWAVRLENSHLVKSAFETLVANGIERDLGTNVAPRFRDRLVVIGSLASGNDLTDRGATPIEKHAPLAGNHWNVASSVLAGNFIHESAAAVGSLCLLMLGIAGAVITWKLRPLWASAGVLLVAVAFVILATWLYTERLYWIPIVLPIASLLLAHFLLLSYRAFFEQTERRRVRNIFAKIVSPNVVQELLKAEKLALGGARREVTVFFADVRGFTELIDMHHARAEEQARLRQLGEAETARWMDAQSHEVLQTVNLYLGAIAEVIKKHEGTLDKYIGDCVMAFWGAPTPNDQHALFAVRAAIEAQRTIYALNQERFQENKRRERENTIRAERGEAPLPALPLLSLGTGVNTGLVTVGLMGSDAHILNYTVFGRDVNLASRLESVSGRGRILIGESTYRGLQRDDPTLAATCMELTPVIVKGFRGPVKVYETPWKPAGSATTLGGEAKHRELAKKPEESVQRPSPVVAEVKKALEGTGKAGSSSSQSQAPVGS